MFVAFLNFTAFSILSKKFWQYSRRFDIHGKLHGVLIFAAFSCSWPNLWHKRTNNWNNCAVWAKQQALVSLQDETSECLD